MFANSILVAIVLALGRETVSMEHLAGHFGWFHSKGYPATYENYLNQQWEIEVSDGYHIKLQFTQFDLEDSYEDGAGPCVYDFVKIEEDDQVIGKYCGNYEMYPWDAPRPNDWIYTEGNKTMVTFVSDYSNENISPKGFLAHYVEIDIDECAKMEQKKRTILEDWDLLVTCNHHCHNVPGSYYCSCRKGYTLHSNNHTCIASFCETQKLTADEGVISSPDYPQYYSKWANCAWDIQVRDGLSILFQFDRRFDIENHYTEFCPYDHLKLTYNGGQEIYCGLEAPGNGSLLDMNTRHVKVEFKSDFSVEKMGFNLTYTTSRIKCLKELSDPDNGYIVSDLSKGFFEFEDVIEFTCNRGYRRRGEQFLTCLSDGQWNYPQPTCEIKSCGRPQRLLDVPHSHIVGFTSTTPTTYLQTLTVECDDWYEQTAGTVAWVCEDDEEWIENGTRMSNNPPHNLPKCTPKCGIKGDTDNPLLLMRISGGTKVTKHEWPWMVFQNYGSSRNLRASVGICGGSLISSRYVLTAAHCVTDFENNTKWANYTHLWFGVHYRKDSESTVKYVQAEDIIRHPLYSSDWNYDVALIRLSESLTMNKKYRPVCLPQTDEELNLLNLPRASGEVAGWGLYDYFSGASMRLFEAEFPVVDDETCWNAFVRLTEEGSYDLGIRRITNAMFCAGFPNGGQNTCSGDSGSPMVMQKPSNGKYYEMGLVSFGIGNCAKVISYTVYAKMNKEIVDWILENSNNLE